MARVVASLPPRSIKKKYLRNLKFREKSGQIYIAFKLDCKLFCFICLHMLKCLHRKIDEHMSSDIIESTLFLETWTYLYVKFVQNQAQLTCGFSKSWRKLLHFPKNFFSKISFVIKFRYVLFVSSRTWICLIILRRVHTNETFCKRRRRILTDQTFLRNLHCSIHSRTRTTCTAVITGAQYGICICCIHSSTFCCYELQNVLIECAHYYWRVPRYKSITYRQ